MSKYFDYKFILLVIPKLAEEFGLNFANCITPDGVKQGEYSIHMYNISKSW